MQNYTLDTFLLVKTPELWRIVAMQQLPLLLVDHAHCEKKAAATAVGLIYRYGDKPALLYKMSALAREELRHFEQVLKLIESRGESYHPLSPGRYATMLHKHVINHEPKKLVDTLIVGAFIEARSCERFQSLVALLEPSMANFYKKLHQAEERHFLTYLELAQQYAQEDISERIGFFQNVEAELITEPDPVFRFHSGLPTLVIEDNYSNSNNSEPSSTKSPIL